MPGGQELTGRLMAQKQTETGWLYQVVLDMWANLEPGQVTAAEYTVWLTRAQVRRPEGISYDQVPTYQLPLPAEAAARPVGESRGWRIEQTHQGTGAREHVVQVVHVYSCDLVWLGR